MPKEFKESQPQGETPIGLPASLRPDPRSPTVPSLLVSSQWLTFGGPTLLPSIYTWVSDFHLQEGPRSVFSLSTRPCDTAVGGTLRSLLTIPPSRTSALIFLLKTSVPLSSCFFMYHVLLYFIMDIV